MSETKPLSSCHGWLLRATRASGRVTRRGIACDEGLWTYGKVWWPGVRDSVGPFMYAGLGCGSGDRNPSRLPHACSSLSSRRMAL